MTEILQGKKFSSKGGPASGWKCAFCGGTGVQPRSLKSRCFPCRGKGEVEFEGPAITCPSCKGKGRSPGALGLACIRCKGVGVVEERGSLDSARDKEAADVSGERLGEITKRLSWARKETEKKIPRSLSATGIPARGLGTQEIEKRLKPVRPFIKEVKSFVQIFKSKMKKIW